MVGFSLAAWAFNASFYAIVSVLVSLTFMISLKSFGTVAPALIASFITSIMSSILFMWLITNEVPTRNGWIAIILVLIASIFAAKS